MSLIFSGPSHLLIDVTIIDNVLTFGHVTSLLIEYEANVNVHALVVNITYQ